jgi:hypothetical protein
VVNSGTADVAPRLQRRNNRKPEDFRERRSTISVEEDVPVCQPMADNYFREKRKISDCGDSDRFVRACISVKKNASARAGTEPLRVIVVGDTCASEDLIPAEIADRLPRSDNGIR